MLLMRIVVTSLFLVLLSHSGARATPIYWSLFNIENETEQEARYVTYATLSDMLNDDNRLGVFAPDGPGTSERNIVGSGAWRRPITDPVAVSEPGPNLLVLAGVLALVGLRRSPDPGGKAGPPKRPRQASA